MIMYCTVMAGVLAWIDLIGPKSVPALGTMSQSLKNTCLWETH